MRPSSCFMVMPFNPELNYFYLYLQRHLKEKLRLEVERGDARYRPGALMKKIKEKIEVAELLIVDISGNNENVLIELGIALACGKDIILITSGKKNEIPTDIRHLEYIRYDLQKHEEFLSKLGKAIEGILIDYEALYKKALELLGKFNSASGVERAATSRDQFQVNVKDSAARGGISGDSDRIVQAEFLLPQILDDPTDTETRKELQSWLENLENKT